MNAGGQLVACIAVVALLAVQFSGLHLHTSEPDESHIVHVHDAHNDGHDHGADTGDSVMQLILLWSKLATALAAVAPTLLMAVWLLAMLCVAGRPRARDPASIRWRPPLRAPPATH